MSKCCLEDASSMGPALTSQITHAGKAYTLPSVAYRYCESVCVTNVSTRTHMHMHVYISHATQMYAQTHTHTHTYLARVTRKWDNTYLEGTSNPVLGDSQRMGSLSLPEILNQKLLLKSCTSSAILVGNSMSYSLHKHACFFRSSNYKCKRRCIEFRELHRIM